MDCQECGTGNAAGAKFCSECGTALARACPGCGVVAAGHSKFCDQCGTALASNAPVPVATPGDGATRKQVTALFADLVGSTAFGESVDGEVARNALAEYFDLLQSTIESHAGFVAKFTGDGVMAVFGLPEVAEDDALRAVAAGRELQRRFVGFTERVRARFGGDLGLRVGINSGELVVGDDDADLVGDVLNTAARLEAACDPGGVLVGEETWRLTRSSVVYEVAGEIRAKGKAEPVATFAVVDATATAADDTTFVGRGDELAALVRLLDEVVDTGSPRLVTVVGAPGVGKTRLAAEVRQAAGVQSFDLRIERRGSTTFSPVIDLIREAAGSTEADAVAALVAEHPEADRLGAALNALLGRGAVRSTEEAFWAVRRLLELLAATEPLVLVIDDIQWAEPLFWDLLEHVAEWTAGPLLVVALARPELRELRPELTHPGRIVAESIALDGLDAETTLELARSLLDGDALPADLVGRLPESTEGNPLFVRELVRMLVDDGVLERGESGWWLTVDAEAIDVPPTVLSLLASRVERLPDDEREVLELASVIGTDFDRGSLVALVASDRAAGMGALLDRLRRKDLVHPSGAWAGDEPLYRFHHVLLRDAAYRRLLKARRAELHERLAHHVVERGVDGTDETDVAAALHFERAHRFKAELGDVGAGVAELADAAVVRLAASAERALDRDDLPAAGRYAVRALALDGEGVRRDELLLLGCEALLSSGDAVGAEPFVDELAERSADERAAAWADCFRAQRWTLTDSARLDEAAELSDAAAARLQELGDDAGVAKARLVRAAALARRGRVGDCEQELDLALGAARRADDRRRVAAVLGATPVAALWGPSPAARAGGRCLDVLRLLHITTASPGVEATSYRCQGVLEALRGRFDSARAKLETSRATARELGLRQGVMETELFAGIVELLAGDAAAAEAHLRTAATGLGELGIGADAGQARALLSLAVLARGDVDEAESLASTAQESAGQNLQTAIASAAALGQVRAAQGRLAEAEELIAAAIALAEPTDVVLDHALALAAGARIAEAAGDDALETARRDAARRLVEEKGSQHWIGVSLDDEASDDTIAVTGSEIPDGSEPNSGDLAFDSIAVDRSGGSFYHRMVDATIANDRAALRSLLSDSFRLVDHRSVLNRGEAGVSEFLDSQMGLADVRIELLEILASRGRWSLIHQRQNGRAIDGVSAGLETQWEHLALSEVRNGRLERVETFDPSARADALARFEELAGAEVARPAMGPTPNAAWRVFDVRATRRLRSSGVESAFAADAVIEFRGSTDVGPLTRDEYEASLQAVIDQPGLGFEGELLAVRGAELCLFRWHTNFDGGENERIGVAEVDGDLVTRLIWFDTSDIEGALEELERLAVEHCMPAVWGELALAVRRAALVGDTDALAARLADDYELFDRRTVSMGPLTRDEYLALQEARPDPAAPIFSEMLRYDDRTMLTSVVVTDDAGNEWSVLMLVRLDDEGLLRRHEVFGPEQRNEALARYDELASAPDGPDPESSGSVGPAPNAAWRVMEAAGAAWRGGDIDAVKALLADGYISRRVDDLDIGDIEADQHVAVVAEHLDDVAADEWGATLLATRGDDLCAFTLDTTVDVGGLRCAVLETRNGQAVSIQWFANAGLADLRAVLDERAIELGLLDPQLIERGDMLNDAIAEGDPDAMLALVADSFELIDHRPLGFGRLDRHEWVQLQVERPKPTVHHVVELIRHEPGLSLSLIRAGESDDSEWWMIHLHELDAHGRFIRLEIFSPEQRADGIARYDELATTPSPDGLEVDDEPIAPNAASRYAAQLNQVMLSGKTERFGAMRAPDFVYRRADALDLGDMTGAQLDAYLERMLAETSFDGVSFERLATRGDDWSIGLMRIPAEDAAWTSINHVTEAGIHLAQYYGHADLAVVLDDLDELVGPSPIRLAGRRVLARLAGGAEASDTGDLGIVTFVDHRGAEGAAVERTWDDLPIKLEPGGRALMVEVTHETDRNGVVGVRVEHADGSIDRMLLVLGLDGTERCERVEVFGLDQRTNAVARFEELPAVGAGLWALRNTATDVIDAMVAQLVAGGVVEGELSALAEPDMRWEELGASMPQVVVVGPDAVRSRDFAASLGISSMDLEVLAVRNGRLAVLAATTEFADGSSLPYLLLVEVSERGRIAALTLFDEDDVTGAFDRLDARWVELGGCAWAAELGIALRATAGGSGISGEALSQAFADDFEWVDHRAGTSFDMTRDQLIDGTLAVAPSVKWRVKEVIEFDGDVALSRFFVTDADGNEWDQLQLLVGRNGLIVRWELFALEDLDAAVARYEELVAEVAGRAGPLDNVSSRVFRASTVLMHGPTDAERERFIEDDFVWRERRRSAPPVDLHGHDSAAAWQPFTELGFLNTDVETLAIRGDDVALVRSDLQFEDGNRFSILAVNELGPTGRSQSTTIFDPDQLDEAMDLLDELDRASNHPSADEAPELENAATRQFVVGAGEQLRGLARGERGHRMEDDFVWRERRRSAPHVELNGEELGASSEVFLASGLAAIDLRVLAIRDDHLALFHVDLRFDSGDVVSGLALEELGPTGRSKSTTIFDPDQLDDAFDLLEQLWLAAEGIDEDWVHISIEDRRRIREGVDGWTVARPDAVWIDHRPLGFGEITGAEFGAMRSTVPGYRNDAIEILAIDGDVMLCRMRAEADDMSAWESWTVMVKDGRELVRVEVFDLDDLPAARSRFDELAAAPSSDAPELENAAVRQHRFGTSEELKGLGRGDRSHFLEPDFVWRERRKSTPFLDLDADQAAGNFEIPGSNSISAFDDECLAIRGDDLALLRIEVQFDNGDELPGLVVVELGPTGRSRSVTVFDPDQLDEAVGYLDELWIARGGCSWWVSFRRPDDAWSDDGADFFAPDGLMVDHRPLGFGTITGGQYEAMQREELRPRIDTADALEFDDRRVLVLARGVRDDAEWWAYLVVERSGDLVGQLDIFPTTELAAARARYDEIGSSVEEADLASSEGDDTI